MPAYAVTVSDTNTANTTALGITSTAAVRPQLIDLIIGSVATPADNAWEYFVQRYTAAGTSTAFTPQKLDPLSAAATSSAGVNHSAEPTYTANEIPLRIAGNQRATFRWVPQPGREIVLAAAANNGVGLLSNAVGGSAVAMTVTSHFFE